MMDPIVGRAVSTFKIAFLTNPPTFHVATPLTFGSQGVSDDRHSAQWHHVYGLAIAG
jgi:hypothetical protein